MSKSRAWRKWGLGMAVAMVAGSAAEGARAESRFDFELRIPEGYYAADSHQSAGGLVGGFRLGDSTWFGKESPFGVLILAGAEGGVLFGKHVDGTLVVGGEVGAQFLGGKDHKGGAGLSLAWAPKMFVNLGGGGEVASPVGAELAFAFSSIRIPIWFLESLDGSTFLGISLSFVF